VGFISGASNVITVLLGYLLLFSLSHSEYEKLVHECCWLLAYCDVFAARPLNLSVGPFLYGGDIGGIVAGFGVNQYLVQILSFAIFLINRELVAQVLLPAYGIKTDHPLFKPWIKLGGVS